MMKKGCTRRGHTSWFLSADTYEIPGSVSSEATVHVL